MSSTSPAPNLENATVVRDLLYSSDPSFDEFMNICENGDFTKADWLAKQPDFADRDLSMDESSFGPIFQSQEMDGAVGEGQLKVSSSWEPMNDLPMVPEESNEDINDQASATTELDEHVALHGQPREELSIKLVHPSVHTPSSKSRQVPRKTTTYGRIHGTMRQRKNGVRLFTGKAIREGSHEGSRKRKEKAKPIPKETWDLMKPEIVKHYITEEKTMKKVKEILERDFKHHLEHCGGKVEEKQILDQLKKWKIQKNVQPEQREYIIRRFLERANMDGKRPLKFFVRGVEVSPAKIERWLKIWTKARRDFSGGVYEISALIPSGVSCRTVSGPSLSRSKIFTPAKAVQTLTTLAESAPFHSDIRISEIFTLSDMDQWLAENLKAFLVEMFDNMLVGPLDINHTVIGQIFINLLFSSNTYRPWLNLAQSSTIRGSQRQEYNRYGKTEQWSRIEERSHVVIRTTTHKTISQISAARERIMVFFIIENAKDSQSLCAWIEFTIDDKIPSVQTKKIFICHETGGPYHDDLIRCVQDDDYYGLKQGIELNEVTPNDGWKGWGETISLLKMSSYHGSYKTTSLLIDLGAVVENGENWSCVLWFLWNGFLHSAWDPETFQRYQQVSDLLIKHGASVEYCVDASPEKGNLLHLHLPCGFFLPDFFGGSPYAFLNSMVQYFTRIGCNLEYRNAHGMTPLLYTASQGFSGYMTDYVSALIRNGANVYATDNEQMGPLHHCIMGFNTQFPDGGNTPTYSDFEGFRTRWQILLSAGCDSRATDKYGKMAKDYVCHDKIKTTLFSLTEGAHLYGVFFDRENSHVWGYGHDVF